jgi:hypothetical protein
VPPGQGLRPVTRAGLWAYQNAVEYLYSIARVLLLRSVSQSVVRFIKHAHKQRPAACDSSLLTPNFLPGLSALMGWLVRALTQLLSSRFAIKAHILYQSSVPNARPDRA